MAVSCVMESHCWIVVGMMMMMFMIMLMMMSILLVIIVMIKIMKMIIESWSSGPAAVARDSCENAWAWCYGLGSRMVGYALWFWVG